MANVTISELTSMDSLSDGDLLMVSKKNASNNTYESKSITGAKLKASMPSSGGGVIIDTDLSDTSTNPVQNKVVKSAVDSLSDRVTELENSGGSSVISCFGNVIDYTTITRQSLSDGSFVALKDGELVFGTTIAASNISDKLMIDGIVVNRSPDTSVDYGRYFGVTNDTVPNQEAIYFKFKFSKGSTISYTGTSSHYFYYAYYKHSFEDITNSLSKVPDYTTFTVLSVTSTEETFIANKDGEFFFDDFGTKTVNGQNSKTSLYFNK